MKYVISDSKLEQTVFTYLENKNFSIRENQFYHFLYNDEDVGRFNQVRIDKESNENLTDEEGEPLYDELTCIIYRDLFLEVQTLFRLKEKQTKKFFKSFIENKFNIFVPTTLLIGPVKPAIGEDLVKSYERGIIEKIEKVIFRYLDSKNFTVRVGKKDGNHYFFYLDSIVITFNQSNGTCLISNVLFNEIHSFATNQDSKIIKDIVKKYVETKLNVEVSNVIVD